MPNGTYYPATKYDDRYCMHYPAIGAYYFRLQNDTKDLIGRGIDNSAGPGGPVTYHSFIRFNDVMIPKRANIVSASLVLTARLGSLRNRPCNVLISFENADNPLVPVSHDDMESRVRTASIEWNNIGTWMALVKYRSPELKTILQPVINRDGFIPGNSIIAYIGDNNSVENSARVYCTYDLGRNYPELYVEWE